MNRSYHTNKYLPGILLFALLFCMAGEVVAKGGIRDRTDEMVKTLTGLQRVDVRLEDHENLVREIFSNNRTRRKAESRITEFLLSEGNHAGKRWLFNALKKTATPAALEYMAEMLTHEESASLALMALEDIPGSNVNRLLKSAFPGASPEIQFGILNVLGLRRDGNSVEFLAGKMRDQNRQLAHAAMSALGKTGTPEAIKILTEAIPSAVPRDRPVLLEALAESAEQLVSGNQPDLAFDLYNTILDANPPETIALAAVKGKMETTSGNPAGILKEHLRTAQAALRYRLVRLTKILPASFRSGQEFLQLPGISDDEKMQLITIFAERNDQSIHEDVTGLIRHENREIRETAIKALSRIGGVEDVPLLVELALTGSTREQEIARNALYTLRGRDIDSFLVQKVSGMEGEPAAEYIKAIGERDIQGADEVLIKTAKSRNGETRMESYKALGKVAGPENLDRIVEMLLVAENPRERQQLEKTLYQVAARSGEKYAPSEVIIGYLNQASESENRSSLIAVLGNIKNPGDMEVLAAYLDTEDKEVRLSAVRALSDWPDAGPLEHFKKILRETEDPQLKALSLKGYTQVILNDNDLSGEKKVEELQSGMSQAGKDYERKLVISALGKVPCIKSLSLLIDEMAEPGGYKPELEAAILNMIPELMENEKEKTLSELKRITSYSDNEEILEWLE